ncbi:MAG: hypothetical protein QOD44_2084 [Solirubrobacteraceae bacterium]|jgi:hypothetical protein|nr:hypothetical protein [Solirubrobacteraceae bacterium]
MHLAARVSAPRPAAAGRSAARRLAVVSAAALSLAAAWVHFAYMSSHFREWWAYGAFFLAVGAGQALLAVVLIRRPAPTIVLAGIAGNVAIIGMYVLSRTAGVPLGPHAHVAERTGAVDVITTAAEVALVGVLLVLLDRTGRRRVGNVLLVIGLALWALRLTGRLA